MKIRRASETWKEEVDFVMDLARIRDNHLIIDEVFI
jgi:uncharacterized protein YjiS (DUF1127 family)